MTEHTFSFSHTFAVGLHSFSYSVSISAHSFSISVSHYEAQELDTIGPD